MRTALPVTESAPPDLLRLAGHPLRWRLMRALAKSDLRVQELSELVREPQNLVSFHLGKLRAGALVTARRSTADRRDSYYSLNLDSIRSLMSGAGAMLHPGLRLVPSDRVTSSLRATKILFLCTGNSARSQMAEALIKVRSSGLVKAWSAGSDPKPLHLNTIRVMREAYGLDLSAQKPTHLDKFVNRRFDWVISLCDRVREVCPDFPGQPEVIHWSVPNPATGEPDEITYPLFQATAVELSRRIEFLLAVLSDRAPRVQHKGETKR